MERIKALCVVLLVVFFASLFQGAVLPIIEGVNYGLARAQYENDTNNKTQEYVMMDVEPKVQGYMQPNEINVKNGDQILMRATNVTLVLNEKTEKPIWWMALNSLYMALTIIVLILGIWIPFLVVKILRSMQHSYVFEYINLARLKRIGILLLSIGLLTSIIQFINILSAEYVVEMVHYSFSYAKVVDFNSIIMGIVILIMTEVMRMAIAMKEEQDLTI